MEPAMEHYDYLIAGGGCAGLSLAYQLVHSPLKNRRILIVDRDDKDQNDRTWAFWTDGPTPFQPIVHQEWRHLRFAAAGAALVPTGSWRYVMIRGDDWYSHIRSELEALPNVTWLKAAVKRIEDREDGAVVWIDTDGRGPLPALPFHAGWVFDSLFALADFKPDPARTLHLQQHFKGWFIETPEDVFDPTAAVIFDFRTPQEGEMRFFYVLPTSPRAALVEYVGLRLADFDVLLDDYIRNVLGISDYRKVSDEIGITPLTDHPFPRRTGRHIMAIGIQGGLVKPTTGYAYTRIQEDSVAIVRSLMENGSPFEIAPSPTLYRWLDRVMLDVMQHEPSCLASTYGSMFRGNPAARVFRFLDERATLLELLGLVMSLPKLPFLRAAIRLALARIRAQTQHRQEPQGSAATAQA
jgi:lycopene beta-cyclase